MSFLLAIGDRDFTEILRSNFVQGGLDVNENEVLHRNYLNEIIELEQPSTVVLHDVYLPSDTATQQENEKEMLDLIEQWRSLYDNRLRVVYLCERERSDPFLASLVARNVLDIFNSRIIPTKLLIEQLQAEPRYSNVSKFGIGTLELDELEEELKNDEHTLFSQSVDGDVATKEERAKKFLTQVSTRARTVMDAGVEWNEQRKQEAADRPPKPEPVAKASKEPKAPKEPKVKADNLGDFLDLMPIPKEVYQRSTVIGTVVVAVAGAKPHLGATHTSMAIASYLHHEGHSVALIEVNRSEDFERIHALYEGEQQYLRHQSVFEYDGFEHYKYREDIRLGEIMATYEYVVLDIGDVAETPHYEEFKRAHVRILLTSPYEWKQHWTDDFCKKVLDSEYYSFVLPYADRTNVKSMEERLPDLKFVPFPPSANPYKVDGETEDAIRTLMQGFLKEPVRNKTRQTIVAASVASAVITSLIIGTFVFLQ